MWIIRWNSDIINKTCAQSFNRSDGRLIVGIAGDDDSHIKGTDERSNGTARLKRQPLSAKGLGDFKTDVPGIESNVFGVADFEVDVASVLIVNREDAKMIKWNQPTRCVTGNNADEFQVDLVKE